MIVLGFSGGFLWLEEGCLEALRLEMNKQLTSFM